jgi:hypothetical protein
MAAQRGPVGALNLAGVVSRNGPGRSVAQSLPEHARSFIGIVCGLAKPWPIGTNVPRGNPGTTTQIRERFTTGSIGLTSPQRLGSYR